MGLVLVTSVGLGGELNKTVWSESVVVGVDAVTEEINDTCILLLALAQFFQVPKVIIIIDTSELSVCNWNYKCTLE